MISLHFFLLALFPFSYMAAAPLRGVETPEPPLRPQDCLENHHTESPELNHNHEPRATGKTLL
jgi:hypothetical protein